MPSPPPPTRPPAVPPLPNHHTASSNTGPYPVITLPRSILDEQVRDIQVRDINNHILTLAHGLQEDTATHDRALVNGHMRGFLSLVNHSFERSRESWPMGMPPPSANLRPRNPNVRELAEGPPTRFPQPLDRTTPRQIRSISFLPTDIHPTAPPTVVTQSVGYAMDAQSGRERGGGSPSRNSYRFFDQHQSSPQVEAELQPPQVQARPRFGQTISQNTVGDRRRRTRDNVPSRAPPRRPSPDIQLASSGDDGHDGCPFHHRQAKRVKLSLDDEFEGYDPVNYGWRGQIDAGQLRLSVASCDGDHCSAESMCSAENVFKNDDSAYCSKTGKCTLFLTHHAGAPFQLETLIIKGPKWLSSPVQHGLVFVGMCQTQLAAAAADYQLHIPSSNRPPSSSRPVLRYTREISSSNGIGPVADCPVSSETTSPLANPSTLPTGSHLDDEALLRDALDYDRDYPLVPYGSNLTTAPSPPVQNRGSGLPAGWQTYDSDGSSDHEIEDRVPPSRQGTAYRYDNHVVIASGRVPPRRTAANGSEIGNAPLQRIGDQLHPIRVQRNEGRRCEGQAEPVRSLGGGAWQGALPGPVARFTINKGASKVTIKFDPPV
jgi:hypothetical protein